MSDIDKEQVAKENWNRYVAARDAGHNDYVKIAKRCDEFYRGEQWDEADRAKLEDEGRPALTINNILSTVNAALGEQANKRADIRFKPRRGKASQEVAAVLTKLVDHILDANMFSKAIEPQVYSDGLIQDRGYYDIRMDFNESIHGEVSITDEDPVTIIPDPQAKSYDPKYWGEVFITRWKSLDQIRMDYGEEVSDKIKNYVDLGRTYGKDSVEVAENTFGDQDLVDNVHYSHVKEGRECIRNIRIIERQYYKTVKEKHFVDAVTGETRVIPSEWDEERIAVMGEQFGLSVIEKVARKVRWVITADNVVLHDEWSPYRSLSIVPYFPYFRRGKPFGMVRNLISPQEFLNKSRSQELHIVNTTANSGWLVAAGALTNMTTEELAERGAESGIVLEHNPSMPTPEKIKPNPVPTGVDRISVKGSMDIKEISGINDSMLGMEKAEVSGVAMETKNARGQVQLQVPFSNLERTRHIVARKVLELVQDFYTEERVEHITNYDEPEHPTEEMALNQITPEGRVINDVTVGEYDVVISSSPARDTFDETQFAETIALRQAGVQIPDHIVVEHSHLQRKYEVARFLKDAAGLGELTPEQQQIQAMQQQLAMQQMQLEVQKLETEIASLQAKSMMDQAKADDIAIGQNERLMQQLQNERDMKMADIKLRLQLAGHDAQTKTQIQEMGNAARLASDAMKISNDKQKQQEKPAHATTRR